jgi:hypothetical protein
MNLALALNRRRTCFQCIPPRLPEYTSSASTLRPRLIPSRAKEKASTAGRELMSNPRFPAVTKVIRSRQRGAHNAERSIRGSSSFPAKSRLVYTRGL